MKARQPRCTTHFRACDCREFAHAEQIRKLQQEIDEVKGKRGGAQRDFYACGEACQMRDYETILGSVLRVVKERDELNRCMNAAMELLKSYGQPPNPTDRAACATLMNGINKLKSL